jgi:hypothetical protein
MIVLISDFFMTTSTNQVNPPELVDLAQGAKRNWSRLIYIPQLGLRAGS